MNQVKIKRSEGSAVKDRTNATDHDKIHLMVRQNLEDLQKIRNRFSRHVTS